MPEQQRAYNEGFGDGKVAQELREHAQHLKQINGSTEKVAERLAAIEMLIRKIIDLADHRFASAQAEQAARDKEVVVVAAALEKETASKDKKSASRWTPVNRWMAVLVGLAVVVGTIVAIRYGSR